MNEAFGKIIEKLEKYNETNCECRKTALSKHDYDKVKYFRNRFLEIERIAGLVKQAQEEYATDTNVGTNGWIPCSERLPEEPEEGLTNIEECDEYIVMIENADIPTALNYTGNGEWYRDGEFYNVIAWQPLPEPYNPET